MIYGYARVSTELQKLDLQLNALSDCDKIFKEKVSGVSKNRSELIKLFSVLRPGDTLKVYKLDRLGRSMTDLLRLIEELKAKNVTFVSVMDNLDTSTANGKLIFHIFAAFAEFERNLISERTKSGLEAARERGVKLGKPHKWTEEELNRVTTLKEEGYKIADISKAVSIPVSTIYRYLSIKNQP